MAANGEINSVLCPRVGRPNDHANARRSPAKWPMPHRGHQSLSARHSTAATVDSKSSSTARVTCANNNNCRQNNLHHSCRAGRLHNGSCVARQHVGIRTHARSCARAHRHTRTFRYAPHTVTAAFLRMRHHSKAVPFESKVSPSLQRCRGTIVAW